ARSGRSRRPFGRPPPPSCFPCCPCPSSLSCLPSRPPRPALAPLLRTQGAAAHGNRKQVSCTARHTTVKLYLLSDRRQARVPKFQDLHRLTGPRVRGFCPVLGATRRTLDSFRLEGAHGRARWHGALATLATPRSGELALPQRAPPGARPRPPGR